MAIALIAAQTPSAEGKLRPLDISETLEVTVSCPSCGTIKTLCLSEDRLVPTRKFRQIEFPISHDYGSPGSCLIFHPHSLSHI